MRKGLYAIPKQVICLSMLDALMKGFMSAILTVILGFPFSDSLHSHMIISKE